MENIVITGSNGFTGYHLAEHIKISNGSKHIVGLDISENTNPFIDEFHQLNICAPTEQLVDFLSANRPVKIFHMAGMIPPADKQKMWEVNVTGTLNLLEAMNRAALNRTIVVSVGSAAEYLPCEDGVYSESDAAYGLTPYGQSKWAQTFLSLEAGKTLNIPVVVARPFNLIGPGLPSALVARQLCDQFAAEGNMKIKAGNIHTCRDFIDIRDAVRAYNLLADNDNAGEIFNISTGKATSINQLIELIAAVFDKKDYEFLRNPDLVKDKKTDFNVSVGNNNKIQTKLDFQPQISLRQSVEDMKEEYIS